MLIDPMIFIQQNNIKKNKKVKVTLPYSDEIIFYKLLDKNIESGKTIAITFPNEKLTTEDSGLYKRIACCANWEEFFDTMANLAKTAIDAYKYFATENVFGLWRIHKKLNQQFLYRAYNVEYTYDLETGAYFLLLVPNGEGNDSKAWMFMA